MPDVTPDELRQLRRRRGWSTRQLGNIVAEGTGREKPYAPSTISDWISGKASPGPAASAFLRVLVDEHVGDGGSAPEWEVEGVYGGSGDDSAPGSGVPEGQTPVLWAGAGGYAKVCEEMFELIATGVGMIGVAVGNDALRRDGLIIHEDRAALGAAYGKLAETNETFRRMLTATEKQGAILAVALATGTTVGKIWRNHEARMETPIVSSADVLANGSADGDGFAGEP